jgi:DNA polymerase I-like protein with 3'-5' exonuclease and polymerase domains
MQLRLRRDAPAFRLAIEASAVLYKAQREIDDKGRIVATLGDYRNAYDAFEAGAAAQAESTDRARLHVVSHKISAQQLQQRLGVASIRTAYDRINRLCALGAIEEDEGKRGRGRGLPRSYCIKKQSLAGLIGGVYPTVESVESGIAIASRSDTAAIDAKELNPEEMLGDSRAAVEFAEIAIDAIDNPKPDDVDKSEILFRASMAIHGDSEIALESPSISSGFGSSTSSAAEIKPIDGVEIALAETYSEAEALIKQMIADAAAAGHSVALDIETAPLPAERARLEALLKEEEAVNARRKEARAAGKKAGADIEAAVAPFDAELKTLARKIEYAEAAGLDPHRSEIRLLQLYGGGGRCAVIDVAKAGAAVLELLRGASAVIHNATFDLAHLSVAGVELGRVNCTMQAARMTLGGAKCGLKAAVDHYCGHRLDKFERARDWAAPKLTEAQIRYAGEDAVWLWRLAERVFQDIAEQGQVSAYKAQLAAAPAIARLNACGVNLDLEAHAAALKTLADQGAAAEEAYRKAAMDLDRPDLAASAPETPQETAGVLVAILTPEERVQWTRVKQKWELSTARSELRKAADKPIVAAMIKLAEARLAHSQWGPTLPLLVSPITGRLHPEYKASTTPTGRTLTSRPNVQGMPRDPRFRSMVRAAAGFVFVAADYGSMDLRTGGLFFEEFRLQQIFAEGGDLHAITAAKMLGEAVFGALVEPWRSEARSKAKALNFGSLYGIMARALVEYAWKNFGVKMTFEEAEGFLRAFADMFPDLIAHREEFARRCRVNRQIVIGRNWRDDRGRLIPFSRFERDQSEYNCSFAYPVQSLNADISATALATIDRKLREYAIAGGPALWIHDELVLEIPEADAEFAGMLLKGAMESAFLSVFPDATLAGLVDVHSGVNWAEAKAK